MNQQDGSAKAITSWVLKTLIGRTHWWLLANPQILSFLRKDYLLTVPAQCQRGKNLLELVDKKSWRNKRDARKMVPLERRGRVAECRTLGSLHLETKGQHGWKRGRGGVCVIWATPSRRAWSMSVTSRGRAEARGQHFDQSYQERLDVNRKTRKFMGLLVTLSQELFGAKSLVIFLKNPEQKITILLVLVLIDYLSLGWYHLEYLK